MRTSQWKSTERAIARRLNGYRLGATGQKNEDVSTDWLCIECKHRTFLPDWIKAALGQATDAAAKQPGKLGAAILHESGKRHDNDIVCLRLKDFEDWFGSVGNIEADTEATP